MDLHLSAAEPNEIEREAVDAVLGPPRSRWDGGPRERGVEEHLATGGQQQRARRHLLLPALAALNDRAGWISEGALNYVCRRLDVAPADAYGVASFYHMFSLQPRPQTVAYVCDDIACSCNGAEALCAQLADEVAPEGAPFDGGNAMWQRSPCLGLCNKAPAALAVRSGAPRTDTVLAPATADAVKRAARHAQSSMEAGHSAGVADARLLAARSAATCETAKPDLRALRRALELGPDGVIEEVITSKLMGRGGAAFPTGRKWQAVARETATPHYIVCNADESEPGTFKDLYLMLEDPEGLLEAMTIAAYAGRCARGFVYVRGEYAQARDRLESAAERLRGLNALGSDILGSGFDFDVEVRSGAGAYICGEETALFNSIEGFRGEPRNKPPFPVQKGLFGKPTIVNNVETLANVPHIVLQGGAAFAKIGTAESTGTKLFCLSGHVERPGLYEVPLGTKLRALIDMAGGVRGGMRLQAVLLGGAAGTFLTPDELDVELSFEGVRAIGATLGSGVVMLFDETASLGAALARIAAFFRHESCGQCVPCRVGTVRQQELLARLSARSGNDSLGRDRTLLADIGQAMRDASICGLGQTASSAIESALAKFDVYGGTAPK